MPGLCVAQFTSMPSSNRVTAVFFSARRLPISGVNKQAQNRIDVNVFHGSADSNPMRQVECSISFFSASQVTLAGIVER